MANAMRVNVFAAAAVIAAVLVAGADAQGLQLPGFIPFGGACNPSTLGGNCVLGATCRTTGGGFGAGGTCQPICAPLGLRCNASIQGQRCCIGLTCNSSGIPGAGGRCGLPPNLTPTVRPRIGEVCQPNPFIFSRQGNCSFGLICVPTGGTYRCGQRSGPTPAPAPAPSPAPAPPAAETLVAAAQADQDLSFFVDALIAANLTEAFTDPSKMVTVLAPTNEAFNELAGTLGITDLSTIPTEALQEVLLYHVIDNISFTSEELTNLLASGPRSFPTSEGQPLIAELGTDGSSIIFEGVANNATVVKPDITAGEGIIHVIDAVLIPFPLGSSAPEVEDP